MKRVILSNGTYGECTAVFYDGNTFIPEEAIERSDINERDILHEDGTITKFVPPIPEPIVVPRVITLEEKNYDMLTQLIAATYATPEV